MTYNCGIFYYDLLETKKEVLFIKIYDVCLDKKFDFYPDNCVKDDNILKDKYPFLKYKEKIFTTEFDKENFIKIFSDNIRRYIKLFGETSMVNYFWSDKVQGVTND